MSTVLYPFNKYSLVSVQRKLRRFFFFDLNDIRSTLFFLIANMNFQTLIQNHLGAYAAAASSTASQHGPVQHPPSTTFLYKMQDVLQKELQKHGVNNANAVQSPSLHGLNNANVMQSPSLHGLNNAHAVQSLSLHGLNNAHGMQSPSLHGLKKARNELSSCI